MTQSNSKRSILSGQNRLLKSSWENFGLLERTKSNNAISIFYFWKRSVSGDIMKADSSRNADDGRPKTSTDALLKSLFPSQIP